MAHDEDLAVRFRELVAGVEGLSEKRMMGGTCFFLNGNMLGGADRTANGERRFMFRVGKPNATAAEALPLAQQVVLGGRPYSGMYFVDAERASEAILKQWLSLAVSFALGLPGKGP